MDKVKIGVSKAMSLANGEEVRIDFIIPRSWGLFEAVDRTTQPTDKMLLSRNLESWGLAHKDELFKLAIEKGGDHIHVM